jgi:hypothetical protein
MKLKNLIGIVTIFTLLLSFSVSASNNFSCAVQNHSDSFLVLNFLIVTFLFLAFQSKYVFDFFFMLASALLSFFISYNIGNFSSLSCINGLTLFSFFYVIFGLALLVLSIVMIAESLKK